MACVRLVEETVADSREIALPPYGVANKMDSVSLDYIKGHSGLGLFRANETRKCTVGILQASAVWYAHAWSSH